MLIPPRTQSYKTWCPGYFRDHQDRNWLCWSRYRSSDRIFPSQPRPTCKSQDHIQGDAWLEQTHYRSKELLRPSKGVQRLCGIHRGVPWRTDQEHRNWTRERVHDLQVDLSWWKAFLESLTYLSCILLFAFWYGFPIKSWYCLVACEISHQKSLW